MITFNNLEEMQPYYNEKTNTYVFDDDVDIKFDLAITANINTRNIKAFDINAYNIDTMYINARNIDSHNINAWNINVDDINAWSIDACNIDAWNISAHNIDALDIDAQDIDAKDISFYAVCFAYNTFTCKSITGRRENAKYFCLDSEVIIKKD